MLLFLLTCVLSLFLVVHICDHRDEHHGRQDPAMRHLQLQPTIEFRHVWQVATYRIRAAYSRGLVCAHDGGSSSERRLLCVLPGTHCTYISNDSSRLFL